MLFKASSFAALSCVKALPPVGAKWGFSTGTGGAPSGVPSTGAAGTSLDATI